MEESLLTGQGNKIVQYLPCTPYGTLLMLSPVSDVYLQWNEAGARIELLMVLSGER